MKITFVIQGLTAGGAERNLLRLANALAEGGDTVTILTFDDGSTPPAFAVSPLIKRIPLGVTTKGLPLIAKLGRLGSIPAKLRRAVRDSGADVAAAFMDQANILTLWALRGTAIPCVVSERVDPDFSSLLENLRSPLLRWLVKSIRNALYRRCAGLVIQTEGARARFPDSLQPLISVIPNALNPAEPSPLARELFVLGAGRLARQKRFDLLIRAFARVAPEFPQWRLVIAGEGPLRDELAQLAGFLGVSAKVEFPGVSAEMPRFFDTAGIFVLSSDFEGFPTVLGEAMAHGCPCIATDCSFGPRDLIRSDAEGLLVPKDDPGALADGLRSLISSPEKRAKMGAAARSVSVRFDPPRILNEWRTLLDAALAHAIRKAPR